MSQLKVGEQQGFLLVKIIRRNTEKAKTFFLITTGKTTGTCFIQKIYAPSSSLLQGEILNKPHSLTILVQFV
jgi:hypothetical protein